MNNPADLTPTIRSWRDIPQPVKPRAMSRGGRWRRTMAGLRVASLILLAGGAVAGSWFIIGTLSRTPRLVPEMADSPPVRRLDLQTSAGGVLDRDWLQRTLALPAGATLMDLDLEKLRARLLEDRQVDSATVTRHFPDRLVARITERAPVARVRVELGDAPRDLLVASDGVVFAGSGFDPAMVASLPWLSGIALLPDGAGFHPIPGMATVTQLLADAQFSAMRLYQTWMSVSLARLTVDRELEVTTRNGTTIVFSTARDFFVQLATLDYLTDKLARTPMARARIDLTLGRNVPVTIEPPSDGAAPARSAAVPAPAAASGAPFRLFPLETLPQR